jgi:hypothetical protein
VKPHGQNREEGDDRRDDGELGYGDDNDDDCYYVEH